MSINIQSTIEKDVYRPGEMVNAIVTLHIEKDCTIHSVFQSMRGEEIFQTNGGKNIHGNNVLFEKTSARIFGETYKSKSMIRIPLRGELPNEYGSTFVVEDCGFSYSYKVYICIQVEYKCFGKPSSGLFKTNKHIELKVRNKQRQSLINSGGYCHPQFNVEFCTKMPFMKERKKRCIVSIEPGSSFELGGRVQFGIFLDTMYLKNIKVQYVQDVVFTVLDSGYVKNKVSTRVTECDRIEKSNGMMRFVLDIPTDIVDKKYSYIFSNCNGVKNYMRFTPTYYSGMKVVSAGEIVFAF